MINLFSVFIFLIYFEIKIFDREINECYHQYRGITYIKIEMRSQK